MTWASRLVPQSLEQRLAPLFRDAERLRLSVSVALGLAILGLGYLPLRGAILRRAATLDEVRHRADLSAEIAELEATLTSYRQRLPERADVNFWSQHLMAGLRDQGLKLHSFEPRGLEDAPVGDYGALLMRLEIEGGYPEIVRFLSWIEHHDLFVRVPSLRVQNREGRLSAILTVAALTTESGVDV